MLKPWKNMVLINQISVLVWKFIDLTLLTKGKDFIVFDSAEIVLGINAAGCSEYTRKQLDELTEWLKRPQIGASGLVYIKCNLDGTFKSSVDKFYSQEDLQVIAAKITSASRRFNFTSLWQK
jgi:Aspartyl-tRNA synthetase